MIEERIDAAIAEINEKIDRVQKQAEGEVTSLLRRRMILEQVKTRITPEIEQAVRALESIGVVVVGRP